MYQSKIEEISTDYTGIDENALTRCLKQKNTKLFYGIPNFQNPTGISYSSQKRNAVAEILKSTQKIMVEDNPYGELNFNGSAEKTVYAYAPDNVIYLGSFSKIFVPSFRLGYVIAPKAIIEKLVIAKQASDLHTNYFVQAILNEYVHNFDIDAHINTIKTSYHKKQQVMTDAITSYLNPICKQDIEIFPNHGGMFIWIRIPNVNAMDLLKIALKKNVAFVPGETFTTTDNYKDQIRLNFTGLSEERIIQGMQALAEALQEYQTNLA